MEPQVEEALATLQAQLAVQHMALKALVHSHPDPVGLLGVWRQIRADAVATAYTLPPGARHSRWLAEHIQSFAEDWTAELVDASVSARPVQSPSEKTTAALPQHESSRTKPKRRRSSARPAPP